MNQWSLSQKIHEVWGWGNMDGSMEGEALDLSPSACVCGQHWVGRGAVGV